MRMRKLSNRRLTSQIKRQNSLLEAANMQNELQLAKLNMVMKAANIGMIDMEIDKDNPLNPETRVELSEEYWRLLGFENADEAPNTLGSWGSLVHPDDQERAFHVFKNHMLDKTGKTAFDVEQRLRKTDGEYVCLRTTGKAMRDEDGNPVRFMNAAFDMTETKNLINEAEKQRIEAQNANRAKSEFLSHISHEIRTPMNAVIGSAEIQLQKEINSPDIEKAFNTIYNSGSLLLNIINDVLDFSKIEAGKLELAPVKYDIPNLVYDTMQLNLLQYESKDIEFTFKIDENTPLELFGDEFRIKQILNNMLSNAFKYTGKGEIELSVSAEIDKEVSGADSYMPAECTLILQVRDTGQGMTDEQINKLFDEYTRFNMGVNRTIVGTGLGMHITKLLIDLMNGEILVESKLGKGSVFTVRLPQKRIGDAVCGTEAADKLRTSRFESMQKLNRAQIAHEYMPYGRVLIVDDIESNLYIAKGMMLPYGLKIETVTSGFEAVDKIKSGNEYDVVFMDHMMPMMDGMEATRIIRDMGYIHPIVALTANAVVGSFEMFLANGFNSYISKPIDIRELNALLNRLIRDKQQPEVIETARQEMGHRKSASAPESPKRVLMNDKLAAAVVRSIEKAIAVLEDILNKINNSGSTDIELFTTTVHGMKGALANIGETDLSSVASKLEQAGQGGETAIISTETPAFIDALQSLVKKFKPKE